MSTEHIKRLTPVNLSMLESCDIDPTQYAISPLLPRGHVTLLGSHGGAGKSVLAECFAAHVATGTHWAGLQTERGRALFVSMEDPGDLVRFRLRRICDAYQLSHADVSENLLILDGSYTDSVLAIEFMEAGARRLAFTGAMEEIEAAAEGRSLVIIDNASDAFSGNENDRQLVRAFVRRLAHIARKHDCAVLLLVHIDKVAARHGSNGNSYSGSTAWHNTVRSRLALLDDSGLSLIQEKLNLGKKAEPIRVEWNNDGVMVPMAKSGSEAAERNTQDDDALLAAIRAAIADGATVHSARTGPCTARTALAKYPDLPQELRRDAGRFWAALTRLERGGRVGREDYITAHRNQRTRLIVCGDISPIPLHHRRSGCAAMRRWDRRSITAEPPHHRTARSATTLVAIGAGL